MNNMPKSFQFSNCEFDCRAESVICMVSSSKTKTSYFCYIFFYPSAFSAM